MRVIGVEEHFAIPGILAAWGKLNEDLRDLAYHASATGEVCDRLVDLGPLRIAAMDATGVDVQVVSHTAPGVQNLPAAEAVALAREANDRLADAVAAHPKRFQGLATVATPDPDAAAAELERAVRKLGFQGGMVFGRTRDEYLDAPRFTPILETAAALRAPLSLHPQSPLPAVRSSLYAGISAEVDPALATHGIGWHYEAGMQLIRLILSGVFDRLPDLQIIIGHWGEVVLFYLERLEHIALAAGLPRMLREYVRDHVWVSASGMLSERYLQWTCDVLGEDRILFSTDYPFQAASRAGARAFLESADVSAETRLDIGAANWDRMTSAIRR